MSWISNIIIYVFPFLIGLSVLIFVHEFGHYFFARLNGVKVETFSIGFGREIWGITDKYGTRWKISWLPIGGYVMMAGDSNAASAPDEQTLAAMSDEEYKQTLYGKSALQRISVFGGGALGNYVYGFIIMAAVFFFKGIPDNRLMVSNVVIGSPAIEAGIMPEDVIKTVNGKKIKNVQELQKIITDSEIQLSLDIELIRKGESIHVDILPREMQPENDKIGTQRRMLGVVFAAPSVIETGLWGAIKAAGEFCINISNDIMRALIRLVQGSEGAKNLGGPIRIAELFGDVSKSGDISKLMFLSAVISINLGFVNLLPLPALDGGSIIISVIELVLRRPVNKKLYGAITYFGFILLMIFMLFVTYNDIARLGLMKRILGFFIGCC